MMMNVQADDVVMIAAALIIITALSVWKMRMNSGHKYEKTGSLPPGPRGLPVVGYMPFLRSDVHRQFAELSHQYGPIFKVWLGSKLFTVVTSPAIVKEMIRDHGPNFANRYVTVASRIATSDFNDIIGSPHGPQWRDLRKLFAREMLSSSNLGAMYSLRREEVRKAIKEMYRYSRIGTPIEFYNLVFQMGLNMMVNMISGDGKITVEKRSKIVAGLVPVLPRMLDLLIKPNVSDFFPALAKLDVQGIEREMKDLFRRADEIVQDMIDDRIKNPSESVVQLGQTDFLQILADLMQQPDNKASSLGTTQLKGMLIDILSGGTDTTAAAIEWVMSELLHHPKAMERAQQELNEVVGLSNIVEEFHTPKLEYLDAVIKETMRVHPMAPLLPRCASHTCNVRGYTIPKDSAILLNAWALHRDPLVWDNPSEFRPERFLRTGSGSAGDEKSDFLGNNFSFVPFGTGRRICAGVPLAERMVRYVLASFLHSFKWEMAEGEELDMSDEMQSALKKRVPLRVIVAPRLSLPQLYH